MTAETLLLPDQLHWDGALRADLALRIGADGTALGVVPAAEARGARRLAGQALLPGLVNAHSHAFQRLIRGRTEYVAAGHASDDFWSWRELMYQAATTLDPAAVHVATRQAFLEMAEAGITAVGEFHYLHHAPDGTPYADPNELAEQILRAAADVGLRICLLRVGYARAGFQVDPNPRQRRFIDPDVDRFLATSEALAARHRAEPLVSVGLAPHSVRAVPRPWLDAIAARRRAGDIVHMHVAEQPAELRACQAEYGRTPVQLLADVGLLRPGFTAVHAIHLAEDEIAQLGQSGAAVCACPSTERNLGDGVIPADKLFAAGVPISLGSDSQATIDLLDDARQLEGNLRLVRQRRAVLDPGGGTADGLAQRLFRSATVEGARSLGLPTGALTAGAPADYFTVDLTHPSLVGAVPQTLLPALIFGADTAAIREVAVAGRVVVQDGRHPLREESARDFSALARRLFAHG